MHSQAPEEKQNTIELNICNPMEGLSHKEMRSCLVSVLKKDGNLRDFSVQLYQLFQATNPGRRTFKRTLENRRLDALARILVGDETCAAIALHNHQLLVVTNNVDHKEDYISISYSNITNFTWNANDIPIAYYHWKGKFGSNNNSNKIDIDKVFKAEVVDKNDHFTIKPINNEVKIAIPEQVLPSYSRVGEEWFVIGFKEQSFLKRFIYRYYPNGFQDSITTKEELPLRLDPLCRRLDAVMDHLSYIANTSQTIGNQQSSDEEEKQYQKKDISNKRFRVLMTSFSWETAKWLKQEKDLREFKNNEDFKKKTDDFAAKANKKFDGFMEDHMPDHLTAGIKYWWNTVATQEEIKKIEPSTCTENNIEKLRNWGWRYFLDLAKLEIYVTQEAKKENPSDFVKFLLHYERQDQKQREEMYEISNDPIQQGEDLKIKKGIHAEMRILQKLRYSNEEKLPYIATSKLCCPCCSFALQQHGVKRSTTDEISGMSGIHCKPYPWVLDACLMGDEFLKTLFGNELYDNQYCKLKNQPCSCNIEKDQKNLTIEQSKSKWCLDLLKYIPLFCDN